MIGFDRFDGVPRVPQELDASFSQWAVMSDHHDHQDGFWHGSGLLSFMDWYLWILAAGWVSDLA
jgi:hypothetical protein